MAVLKNIGFYLIPKKHTHAHKFVLASQNCLDSRLPKTSRFLIFSYTTPSE